jgi:hypothetical protein
MKEEEDNMLNKVTILHPKIVTTMAAASAAPNEYIKIQTLQQEGEDPKR